MFFEDWGRIGRSMSSVQNALNEEAHRIRGTIQRLDRMRDSLLGNSLDVADTTSKKSCASLVFLKYNTGFTMKPIKILTTDFYATSVIIPAITKIRETNHDLLFDVKESTIDYMPEDADFKFFQFSRPSDDYIEENILKTELNLYASSDYLNRCGEPKALEDMGKHTTVLTRKADVLTKIGGIDYRPIRSGGFELEVDSINSLVAAGESGLGIVCFTDKSVAIRDLKLEKINKLADTIDISFVFSVHKKRKDSPLLEPLKRAIEEELN